jgi:hypothetical protein
MKKKEKRVRKRHFTWQQTRVGSRSAEHTRAEQENEEKSRSRKEMRERYSSPILNEREHATI